MIMVRKIAGLVLALIVLLLTATPGAAQGGRAAAPQPPRLTLEDAQKAIDAAEAEARKNSWNVTIVIVDSAGVPIYLRRMNGAAARSYDIAMNKARTSASTGLTTIEYGQRRTAGTIDSIANGITFEGGLPIRISGRLMGGIGTSGVRANQDAQISRAGLAAIGGT
jgi:glc operon protein GlcG